MKPGSQCGNFRGIVFRHGFEAECLVLLHLSLVDKTEAMQIVPTEAPGESDVVIDVKRTKRWSVVASVDNSGSRDTGNYRGASQQRRLLTSSRKKSPLSDGFTCIEADRKCLRHAYT